VFCFDVFGCSEILGSGKERESEWKFWNFLLFMFCFDVFGCSEILKTK
jgi:hypothetical protein